MDNILQLVIAVTGGGGIGFFLNYLISKRQTDQSDFEVIIARWELDNERLREKVERDSLRIETLQTELINLKAQMTNLESSHFDLPLAQCVKDLDGTIILVNREFTRLFLTPYGYRAEDCIGKKGGDLWGEEIEREHRKEELGVLITREPKHLIENNIDPFGNPTKWKTFRYPINLAGKPIAIGQLVINQITDEN